MKNKRRKKPLNWKLCWKYSLFLVFYINISFKWKLKELTEIWKNAHNSGTVRTSWKGLWLWEGYKIQGIATSSLLWWLLCWPTNQQKWAVQLGILFACLFLDKIFHVLWNCEIMFTILFQLFGHLLLRIDEIRKPLYISE